MKLLKQDNHSAVRTVIRIRRNRDGERVGPRRLEIAIGKLVPDELPGTFRDRDNVESLQWLVCLVDQQRKTVTKVWGF